VNAMYYCLALESVLFDGGGMDDNKMLQRVGLKVHHVKCWNQRGGRQPQSWIASTLLEHDGSRSATSSYTTS
jgi:hypothetical protein